MKKLLTLLITILLSTISFSKPYQTFEGMSKGEIKQFLQEQENAQIQGHLTKYRNKKTTGIGLLLFSVIAAFSANGKKKIKRSNKKQIHSTLFITVSGILFITGMLLLATADTAFNKSKEVYSNLDSPVSALSYKKP